jgi:hypothetical protein
MTGAQSQGPLEDTAVDAPSCNGNRDIDTVLALSNRQIPT